MKPDAERIIRRGLFPIIGCLGFCMFHFWGNTYSDLDVRETTRSLFVWLGRRWKDSALSVGGVDYSHGWIIPLVSAWLVWRRRAALRAAQRRPNPLGGIPLLALALAMHWMGAKAEMPQLSALALVLLLWAVPLYLRGWATARLLAVPCAYLLFCVPWGFFDSITFPLRLWATQISAGILNGLNIPAERVGTAIYSRAGGGFNFDVADPCSGIRSLLAIMALTAAYAYVTQRTTLRQWILFFVSIPLALIGNIARIIGVALVAVAFGPDIAVGVYHDYSGYILYAITVLLMLAAGRAMNAIGRNKHARRAQASPAPEPSILAPPAEDWRCPLAVVGMMSFTVVMLIYGVDVNVAPQAGVSMELPSVVGDWTGREQWYCQNPQCMKCFTLSELGARHVCPACGERVDALSLAERQLLPPDTALVRKLYANSAGEEILATVLLSGRERASIHRAEICLTGQGNRIVKSAVFSVPLPNRKPLQVMRLDIERPRDGRAPQRGVERSLFAYWFVGKDRETPWHLQRLFWMSFDRVFRNVAHRWAYISLVTSAQGPADDEQARLGRFIAVLYPHLVWEAEQP